MLYQNMLQNIAKLNGHKNISAAFSFFYYTCFEPLHLLHDKANVIAPFYFSWLALMLTCNKMCLKFDVYFYNKDTSLCKDNIDGACIFS